MAKRAPTIVCQNCGAVYQRWQGKCDACGEWNTIVEEAAAAGVGGAAAARRAAGRGRFRSRVCRARSRRCAAHRHRHRRARPRHRRRLRAGLGDAARRRSGHRQVDPADPGLRRARAQRRTASSISRARRRSAQVRLRAERLGLAGRAGRARRRDQRRGHRRDARRRATPPQLVIIDSIQTMWTDAVESAPGTVTQVRGSRAGADPLRQDDRRRCDPGRPCHQGRADRRAARRRAHGRRGRSPSRATAATHFRILRAVKNRFGPTDEIGVFEMTGRRPRRGAESLGAVPRRARLGIARARRSSPAWRARGRLLVEIQALVAPTLARHAAPRRGRLGRRAACHGARRARGPWRPAGSAARRLSQCRRRLAHRRAGGRPCGGGGARFLADRRAACRPNASISARSRCRARVRPVAHAGARLKEAAKLGFGRAIGAVAAADSGERARPSHGRSVTSAASLVADIAARAQDATRAARR